MSPPSQWCSERRQLSAAFSKLAFVALLLAGGSGRVAAEDPKGPVHPRSPAALAALVRTQPPTPEITAELKRADLDAVFDLAMAEFRGVELLNVLENILAVGTVPHMKPAEFEYSFGTDVLFEGVVTRVQRAGTDRRAMDVDLRRVLRGNVTLTPENSPLRLGVGVDIGPGKPSFEETVVGKLVFVRANRLTVAQGTTDESSFAGASFFQDVYEDSSVWLSTGREGELFQKAWPLFARDAAALLRAMKSKDETEQWLGCARVASTCARLGGAFQSAIQGALSKERMAQSRGDLTAALEPLCSGLIWDRKAWSFVRK